MVKHGEVMVNSQKELRDVEYQCLGEPKKDHGLTFGENGFGVGEE